MISIVFEYIYYDIYLIKLKYILNKSLFEIYFDLVIYIKVEKLGKEIFNKKEK